MPSAAGRARIPQFGAQKLRCRLSVGTSGTMLSRGVAGLPDGMAAAAAPSLVLGCCEWTGSGEGTLLLMRAGSRTDTTGSSKMVLHGEVAATGEATTCCSK